MFVEHQVLPVEVEDTELEDDQDVLTSNAYQLELFTLRPPRQLLKWVGNKQRYACQIANLMPEYNTYIEPFLGSGAILGTLAPASGIAGDILEPLIRIWQLMQTDPQGLLDHYAKIWNSYVEDREIVYTQVLASYNAMPNPYDLLFLCRACYGGVVRFTKDGKMSTPVGVHRAISPMSLKERLTVWRERVRNTTFVNADFEQTMACAKQGDLVYCDPPYEYTQRILYGAQKFSLKRLWVAVEQCKLRGARVALSLDGKKKSGTVSLNFDIPQGLFEREVSIDCGGSMLRRFQKRGETMENEVVHDRLLLTW
jgi:DNA adenine methylase